MSAIRKLKILSCSETTQLAILLRLITWKAVHVPKKTAAQWEVSGKKWYDSVHWNLFSAFTRILNR